MAIIATNPHKGKLLQLFLALSFLEGCLALIAFFQMPSMGRNAWLFGFSASRLLTGGLFLGLLGLVGYGLIFSLVRPGWLSGVIHWLEVRFQREDVLASLVLALVYLPLFAVSIGALGNTPGFERASTFQTVYDRFKPLMAWLVMVSLQAAVALLAGYAQSLHRQKGIFNSRVFLGTLVVLLLLSTTLAHWAILALRIPLFISIPGWYWSINNKGFGARDFLFLGLSTLIVVFAGYALRHPQRVRWNMAVLMLLAYLLQISIGFVEGQGFESLRRRYTETFHRAYAAEAVKAEDNLVKLVRTYEDRYGQRMFLDTKPPGVLVIYVLFERAANLLQPLAGNEERYQRLTMLIAVIFPLLATLALPVVYLFGRQFTRLEDPQIPALLYMVLPGIILFAQYLDQMLYPAMFLAGIGLVTWVVRSRKPWLWFLAGIFLYLAAFIVFSMLGLAVFLLALLGLDFLFERAPQGWVKWALGAVGKVALALAGALLVGLLFYTLLDYHIDTRYKVSMEIVHNYDFYERVDRLPQEGVNPVVLRLSQMREAALLNNVEFAAGIGLPVFWLFVGGAVTTLAGFVRDPSEPQRRVLVALLATFVGLNLFGQMRGEAARLWLLWAPMFVTFAGVGLQVLFIRRRNAIILCVLVMELVTLFLTYKFQDLVM